MEEVVNGIWRYTGDLPAGRQGTNVYLAKELRCWLIVGVESVRDADRLLGELEKMEDDLSSRPFLIVPSHLQSEHIEGLATLAVLQDGLVVLPTIFFRPEVTGGRVKLPFVKRFKRWWVGRTDYAAKAVADEFIFRVKQGQRLPFAGGWQAIFTTKYGEERIFLYHPGRKILVPGEVIIGEEGEAKLALEGDAAREAISRLRDLKVETILPGRGDVITGRYVFRDLLLLYSPADF